MSTRTAPEALCTIRVVHTAVWAFFAASILAIPLCAWMQRLGVALVLIAIVFVEVLVLLVNGWNCPLTRIAARYTDDRRANFDIFLPEWLARHNKLIFGILYLLGILVTLGQWGGWLHGWR